MENLIEKIKEAIPKVNDEGNLLAIVDDETKEIQTSFLKKYLLEINPEFILETGTNAACFSAFVKEFLPAVKIVTFGRDPWSADCIKIVEDHYDDRFIQFVLGDSTQTMPLYVDQMQKKKDKPSAAWVDGGHLLPVCLSDLKHCYEYGIDHIFLDDINPAWPWQTIVPLYRFMCDYPYEIIDMSHDKRGIAYLRKNPNRAASTQLEQEESLRIFEESGIKDS